MSPEGRTVHEHPAAQADRGFRLAVIGGGISGLAAAHPPSSWLKNRDGPSRSSYSSRARGSAA